MKYKKLLLPPVILILLGCSSEPSESDVKKSISSVMSTCEDVTIEKVKKINGIPDGNNKNKYLMEVNLKFSVTPTKETKSTGKEYLSKYQRYEEIKDKLAVAETGSPEMRKLIEDADIVDFDISGYRVYLSQLAQFRKKCKPNHRIAQSITSNVFSAEEGKRHEKIKLLVEGGEVELKGKFNMIKTDNGWEFER